MVLENNSFTGPPTLVMIILTLFLPPKYVISDLSSPIIVTLMPCSLPYSKVGSSSGSLDLPATIPRL